MVMRCIETDLDTMFSPNDFGEDVGAVRNGDSAHPIPGIFDDEDVEVTGEDGQVVLIASASFACRLSLVPNLADGDTLLVRGTTYTIRYWKRDGAGQVDLFLEAPS